MPSKVTKLRPLQDFLRTEAASGLLLLVMVPVAVFWANGPFAESYSRLWSTEFGINWGPSHFDLDLRHWINDGLMTLFFFVVGLEIKREFVDGDLRDRRKALTPVLAAIGGMALPALIFSTLNYNGEGVNGWGIPMATDIAIVLGLLALLGSRVPSSLKTFLLTLAIVDDIGAILVIAFFYTDHSIDFVALAIAAGLFLAILVLHHVRLTQPTVTVLLAICAWAALHSAGIHATLTGVILALLTPARPLQDPHYVDVEALGDVSSYDAANETVTIARQSVSSVEWLQHVFHPWSSYLVLPLFALANAGIAISTDSLSAAASSSVAVGAATGLLLGKPVGICLATLIATKVLGGSLPTGVRFRAVAAGSILAAVGFTVSLFISDLAFDNAQLVADAKVGVIAASLIAGTLGYFALRLTLRTPPLRDE